jgi:VIT1/CCC1 family predicted Fe2+/Mn2+ transporter
MQELSNVSRTFSDDDLASQTITDVQERGLSKPVPYTAHNGEHRQYMRDIILGINDGLVSMFLLVFGMSGGNADAHSIALASVAGAIAGAISMGLGEYIATKSQAEVIASDLELEKIHFVHHRDVELEELKVALAGLGLRGNLLNECVDTIGSKDETLLKFMQAFEFGHTEDDQRNPVVAMTFSALLFMTGALPSVIPFLTTNSVQLATIISGVLCCCTLFAVGSVKCVVTKTNWLWGGTENLLLGAFGAGFSYGIGLIFHAIS